jgi:uncharacterized protein (DUF433 family)
MSRRFGEQADESVAKASAAAADSAVFRYPDGPALKDDGKGGLRIGKSRVLLELLIQAHLEGDSPEAILRRYPTLTLADVYTVIAFNLRHPADVEEYLVRREQQAREVWERIEKRQGSLTTNGSDS